MNAMARTCEFCESQFDLRSTSELCEGLDDSIDTGLETLTHKEESVYHGLCCRECAIG